MTWENAKTLWTKIEPYLALLWGMIKQCLALAWTALRTLLKPFWVPAVTLARNPLTAVVVGVLVVGSYIGGDLIRSLKDQKLIEDAHDEAAIIIKASTADNAKKLATLNGELAEQKKTIDGLEVKLKAAGVAAKTESPRKVTAKPVAVVTKPWWQ